MAGFSVLPGGSTNAADSSDNYESAKAFLHRVLPAPTDKRALSLNRVNLWKSDDGKPHKGIPGSAFLTVDSLIDSLRYWQRRNARENGGQHTSDYYIAMGVFKGWTEQTSEGGRIFRPLKRVAQNLVAKRGFYADLDVKPGAYATLQDAIDAVEKLVDDGVLLEPTAMVCSGGGLHVHWVTEEVTNINGTWMPVAHGLAKLLSHHGIHHDPQACNDAVRILRMPDCWNCKQQPALPTYLIGDMLPDDYTVAQMHQMVHAHLGKPGKSKLTVLPGGKGQPTPTNQPVTWADGSAIQANLANVNAGLAGGSAREEDNFSAGIGAAKEAKPVDFSQVLARCATLRGIHERAGAGDTEPLWALAILATTFAPDGRKWAHELSSGYEFYTPADTDEKFDQKLQARQTSNTGWPSCQAFSGLSPACLSCPLLERGKSPLSPAPGVDAFDPAELPFGYRRHDGAIVKDLGEGDDGEPKFMHVIDADIQDAFIEQVNGDHALNIAVAVPNTPVRRMSMPLKEMNAWQRGALDVLSVNRLSIPKSKQGYAQEFFVAFVNHLNRRLPAQAKREQFGWTETLSGLPGFAFGNLVHGPHHTAEPLRETGTRFDHDYGVAGELDPWKKAAQFVVDMARPDLQLMMATSFAAPLVRFTGLDGLTFALSSILSSRQKSTALKVAASVWGNPKRTVNRLDDTSNSMGNKLGVLRHLPVYWDEIQNEQDAEQFAKLVFSLSLGTEKARLNSDASQRHAGSWSTMLVCASNVSVRGLMMKGSTRNSDAGVNRVFEVIAGETDSQHTVPVATALQTIGALEENYGTAGRIYASFLAEEADQHRGRITAMMEALEKNLNASSHERFWIGIAAVLLVGASYAKRLGLVDFDMRAFRTKLFEDFNGQRTQRENDVMNVESEEFAADLLFRYISYCRTHNSCMETDHVVKGPGRATILSMKMPSPEAAQRLRDPKLHLAHSDRIIRMLPTEFKTWLQNVEKTQWTAPIKVLERYAGMTTQNLTWGGGTPWRTGQMPVYEITLDSRPSFGARFELGAP